MRVIGLGIAVSLLVALPASSPAADLGAGGKNPAKVCKALRSEMGAVAFRREFGTNANGANAFGKCVSLAARGELPAVQAPAPIACEPQPFCATEPPLPVVAFGAVQSDKHPAKQKQK